MQTTDPIARTIADRLAALQDGQRLAAWSLIVTFLGDAVSPRGGVVSAATLQAVLERLGIGHGAVRTAISRLAADGWIDRSREGRNSFYRLSPGVAETVLAAERRIYAPSSLLPADTPRTLAIAAEPFSEETCNDLDAQGALLLTPQVALCFADIGTLPQALRPPQATLATAPSLVPGEDLRERLAEARQSAEIAALQDAYGHLAASLEALAEPAPEEAMALRTLMIHEWRRAALRVLPVPADLVQPGDPEPRTRALIAAIYHRILGPSEAWLDVHAATPEGPLPPPDPRLGRRFRQG